MVAVAFVMVGPSVAAAAAAHFQIHREANTSTFLQIPVIRRDCLYYWYSKYGF